MVGDVIVVGCTPLRVGGVIHGVVRGVWFVMYPVVSCGAEALTFAVAPYMCSFAADVPWTRADEAASGNTAPRPPQPGHHIEQSRHQSTVCKNGGPNTMGRTSGSRQCHTGMAAALSFRRI